VLILAWLLVRGFGRLVLAIGDDLLVLAGMRWRASMGRTRWR
jgi:hypothetical protein